MKKPRAKNKSKSGDKKTKEGSYPEIVIHGQLDGIADHLKQMLLAKAMDFETIKAELERKITDYPVDKLPKIILRTLKNNPVFIEKDGKWTIDKRGKEQNNPLVQWLSTMACALTFAEIRQIAAENCLKIGLEKDLVWDSRFVRLKRGKWGLSCWRFLSRSGEDACAAALQAILQRRQPLSIKDLYKEIKCKDMTPKMLEEVLAGSAELVCVGPGLLYARRLVKEMETAAAAGDPLEVFRMAETNVLQEAELMLIIKDNLPNKKQYVLSSLDLERGQITLTKRLEKVFKDFPAVCYLNFQINGNNTGIWYLQKYHLLQGFKEWYEQCGLEPGHILELGWNEGEGLPAFSMRFTGEREAEVFSEGMRILRLSRICASAKARQLGQEEALCAVLELYPAGLSLHQLQLALKAMGMTTNNLEALMNAYPFFEETGQAMWRCNAAMKVKYFDYLQQLKAAQEDLDVTRQEVASTLAEARVLRQEKENLHDELTYLQNLHREEQALYQQKLSELAVQNEHLQLENTRLKAELDKMQQREEQLLQEMENQSQQMVALRQDKNKLKVKNEQLENKVVQLQGNLNRLMENAQEEIVHLKKTAQEKASQLESLQYANQELQKNLARLHEERRDLKRKLSSWPVRVLLSIFNLWGKKDTPGLNR